MGSATFIIAAAVLLAAVLLVRGSASVRASWYLRMRCRARRAGRRVALTFDDGPDPQRTPAVLDLLARQGVRATFFVVGARAEAHPELVRRMATEGHVVGNHSYTHSWRFPLRSLGRTMEELCRTGEVLHRITGRQPRLFRPPFGVTNPTIAQAVRRLGNFFDPCKKHPCFAGISCPLFTAMIYFFCIFILLSFCRRKRKYIPGGITKCCKNTQKI